MEKRNRPTHKDLEEFLDAHPDEIFAYSGEPAIALDTSGQAVGSMMAKLARIGRGDLSPRVVYRRALDPQKPRRKYTLRTGPRGLAKAE